MSTPITGVNGATTSKRGGGWAPPSSTNGHGSPAPANQPPAPQGHVARPLAEDPDGTPLPDLTPESRVALEAVRAKQKIDEETVALQVAAGTSEKQVVVTAEGAYAILPPVLVATGIIAGALKGITERIAQLQGVLEPWVVARDAEAVVINKAHARTGKRIALAATVMIMLAVFGGVIISIDSQNVYFQVDNSGLFDDEAPDWAKTCLGLAGVLLPPVLLKLTDWLLPPEWRRHFRVAIALVALVVALGAPFVYADVLGGLEGDFDPTDQSAAGDDQDDGISLLIRYGMYLVALGLYGIGLAFVAAANMALDWRREINDLWERFQNRVAPVQATLGKFEELGAVVAVYEDAIEDGKMVYANKTVAAVKAGQLKQAEAQKTASQRAAIAQQRILDKAKTDAAEAALNETDPTTDTEN